MNKKTIRWTFALILVVLLVLPVGGGNYVQETVNWYVPETYNISGYVKSTTGSGITGVSITNNLTDASDTTIASGYYILHDLCNRTYLITATKAGYVTNSTAATINGAGLTNINITLTAIAAAPNITSWYNNYTSDNSTDFTITHEDEDNRTIFFNVTADDSIDYWVWYVGGVLYQNSSSDNITKTWDEGGNKTVSVYGVNANGKTQTLYWYITIEYTEYEISLFQLAALEAQVEAEEMLAQTWIFLILLLINFALVFFVFKDTHDIFYGDSGVSIATIIVSFLSVTLSFILARRALIEPILMPELNYFLLAVALVMVVLLARFVIQIVINTFYAMKTKAY